MLPVPAVSARSLAIAGGLLAALATAGCREAISPGPAVTVPAVTPANRPITAGAAHSCRLTSSGAAYCWGDNYYGQLGNGSATRSSVPVAVSGGLSFSEPANPPTSE